MKAIIIKFEGIRAICKKEDLSVIPIRRANLPAEALEGDLLNIGNTSITVEKKGIKNTNKFKIDILLNLW